MIVLVKKEVPMNNRVWRRQERTAMAETTGVVRRHGSADVQVACGRRHLPINLLRLSI